MFKYSKDECERKNLAANTYMLNSYESKLIKRINKFMDDPDRFIDEFDLGLAGKERIIVMVQKDWNPDWKAGKMMERALEQMEQEQ